MADLPDDLQNMLRRLFEDFVESKKAKSNNPEDYPRSATVVDVEALQIYADMMRKRKKLDELMSEAQAEFHESEGIKARFFILLKKRHPDIDVEDGGTRFCSWKGKVYYVGWDKHEGSGSPTEAVAHPEGGQKFDSPIPAGENVTDADLERLLKGEPTPPPSEKSESSEEPKEKNEGEGSKEAA